MITVPPPSFAAAKVYLVGAGLGPVAYLTQRAIAVLGRAEVVIYDALVSQELFDLLPPDCERIFVGKRAGKPSTPQAKINQLLLDHYRLGKRVVRLKSGDPWIFGRLLPELATLVAHHCAHEVIPGVSSAIASAGLVGIPLTAKDTGTGFFVMDGHDPHGWPWPALAQLPTLVILMGTKNLPVVVDKLLRAGKSPGTPMAVIKNAGRPEQQTWGGTLADMVEKTQGQSLAPGVIVVGDVVDQRIVPALTPLPLAQKTILVTRAADQASQFTELLQQQGANVLAMAALEIVPPTDWRPVDQAIAKLGDFDWLILTSANGVEFFFQRLQHHGWDSRALAGLKLAVVGKKTAQSLEKFGIKPDFIPPDFIADALVEHFPQPPAGLKILFPRVESGGRAQLVQELRAKQALVTEVPAYQSACPAHMPEEVWQSILNRNVDVITFASSKTVTHFRQLLAKNSQADGYQDWRCLINHCQIASIGPQTSERCLQELGQVDIEATEYTLEGLTRAIIDYVHQNS
ncbi:uroporphyrinogen-III C-methyltransferase [Synechocystis sp. FACHB-383]|uniref:uroporphyrinogen-III C-methyltransferase n=1 Tax=Synechocystis sp. FACHB-383 TaxID=2692864 RepID=UPI001684002F|nr:uroporphyrinogen-III C-methyltransferase [Synechocystis sp. FACHB-383]MBD2652655.1 uroporphyrinogen-III C-methyltransferase [Synechocystis sp. FACHB-383]